MKLTYWIAIITILCLAAACKDDKKTTDAGTDSDTDTDGDTDTDSDTDTDTDTETDLGELVASRTSAEGNFFNVSESSVAIQLDKPIDLPPGSSTNWVRHLHLPKRGGLTPFSDDAGAPDGGPDGAPDGGDGVDGDGGLPDGLNEEVCKNTATNFVTLNDEGELEPAACTTIQEVHVTASGLLARLKIRFDTVEDYKDAEGNITSIIADTEFVDGYLLVDLNTDATAVVGLVSPSTAITDPPVVGEYFGETANKRLVFRDGPSIYNPADGTVEQISSAIFGDASLNYITGNFLIWQTGASIYQIYDTARKLRYNSGSNFPYITALSPDVALVDDDISKATPPDYESDLLQMADGTRPAKCVIRGGIYTVQECTTGYPCIGGAVNGAVMRSTGCDGTSSGEFALCHVDAMCSIKSITTENLSNLVAPVAGMESEDPRSESRVLMGASYYIMREVNRIFAVLATTGEVTEVPTPIGFNLAYLAAAANTVYYAGEMPDATPVFKSYDLDRKFEADIELKALDRIFWLH